MFCVVVGFFSSFFSCAFSSGSSGMGEGDVFACVSGCKCERKLLLDQRTSTLLSFSLYGGPYGVCLRVRLRSLTSRRTTTVDEGSIWLTY